MTPSWTPRRSGGGARVEATERLIVRAPGFETSGWTLNMSRGGLRAILEDRIFPDIEYEVLVGDATLARRAVFVWAQEQADGQIVGLKYLDLDGSMPPREGASGAKEE